MKRTQIKILVLGPGKRPRKEVADLLARAGYTVTTEAARDGKLSGRIVVLTGETAPARTPGRRTARGKVMNLQQLREHVRQTQGAVARRASVSQPQLSRVEGRRDHLVSTVRKYVRALGGDVQVVAEIGPERIVLRDV
ncbi:MAG TPA: helix-turn-helix domain-containing protein [Polyangia bacterium]|nr:helix-turn-helix domain-containing protein [Polyangia bacterium]